jgi:hypothetical protein
LIHQYTWSIVTTDTAALWEHVDPGGADAVVDDGLHDLLAVEDVPVPSHGGGVGLRIVAGGGVLFFGHVLGDDLDGNVGPADLDHLGDLAGRLEHAERPERPYGGPVAGISAGGVGDEPDNEARLEDVLREQLFALVDVAACVHGRRVGARLDEEQRRRPEHERLAAEGPVLDDPHGVGDHHVGHGGGHPHGAAPAVCEAVKHQEGED